MVSSLCSALAVADSLQAWYAHKQAHPWLFASLNGLLSKITPDDWKNTPNNSNLTESAHAGKYADISTNVSILEAVIEYV
jgi:hypothetical protein